MKQPINEIKRMQRIAGLITEGEYQEAVMNESDDDVKKLKRIIARDGMDEGKIVAFEIYNKAKADDFKNILKALKIKISKSYSEVDGGTRVFVFEIDKQQLTKVLGDNIKYAM